MKDLKLAPVAVCPYCGRYVKRGLMFFAAHMDKCPSRNVVPYKFSGATSVKGDFEWDDQVKNTQQVKFIPRETGKFNVL